MKQIFSFYLLVIGFTMSYGQKTLLQEALNEAKLAGFSGVVLVAKNGKIVMHESVGMRRYESSEPMGKQDIFEWASVSKQFTAMIIMMLKEKGKLRYDDPISQYVQVPYSNITIRHLLTHTSGLPDYHELMDRHWDKSKVAGNPDILAMLNRYAPPILFRPGERYEYSNTGYVLLGSIAEKASGEDFVTLCRKWIFKPLKMTQTDIRTYSEKAHIRPFAVGHLPDSSKQYVNANRFPASDFTLWLGNRKGPGRISGSATDLLKWDRALYTQKLVRRETLEEAFSPARLNDGTEIPYGFGWEVLKDEKGHKVVQHTGGNPGYSTIIVRFLETQKTIIILNNNAHESMNNLVLSLKRNNK
ncbi:MAG: beta-lactamase family protein [Bacteroidetes Order II. Incertae sedis bacterium]|nr:beta-lactamase family protein [Bacteroidetes Order II. bacterium]